MKDWTRKCLLVRQTIAELKALLGILSIMSTPPRATERFFRLQSLKNFSQRSVDDTMQAALKPRRQQQGKQELLSKHSISTAAESTTCLLCPWELGGGKYKINTSSRLKIIICNFLLTHLTNCSVQENNLSKNLKCTIKLWIVCCIGLGCRPIELGETVKQQHNRQSLAMNFLVFRYVFLLRPGTQ